MKIVEQITDMAGKIRVMVEIDNTRSIPLKYQSEPTQEQVFADAQAILDREAAQAELDSWTPIDFEL